MDKNESCVNNALRGTYNGEFWMLHNHMFTRSSCWNSENKQAVSNFFDKSMLANKHMVYQITVAAVS